MLAPFRSEGKCFGAFWIRENRVVGTFLETASDEEHDKIKALAKERPAADNIEGLLKDIFGRPMPLVRGGQGREIWDRDVGVMFDKIEQTGR